MYIIYCELLSLRTNVFYSPRPRGLLEVVGSTKLKPPKCVILNLEKGCYERRPPQPMEAAMIDDITTRLIR